jgi:rifampicin phosphotransferase
MRVAWLGEPESLDEALVGGKTANLGRLATSFRVPPGFCLDAAAFDHLRPALEGDSGARARLRELVAASYADLAQRVGYPEPRVAVRSSAIGEDAADASFAGQHETVLDVGGVDAIVDALLECWRSVFSERASAYRRERGITAAPRIAVLVQLMVPADASAIAFSADPVNGARDVVVINAARGLGDAIASGAITPDSYTVRKGDLAIVSRSCANGAALPDDAVAAVARLAMQLETVMGRPVDIECALRDGELHLLQCRPITTLADEFPIEWSDPEDAKLTWQLEISHFHRPLPPLASDYILNSPYYGMQKFGAEIGSPLKIRALVSNGRIYESAEPMVEPAALPARLTAMTARRRAIARHVRQDWDERYVPELRAHYAWMRALPVDRVSPADAADAWGELWRRVNRIWTIHFIAVLPAYAVMEELAQMYEQLMGGDGAVALTLTQGLAPTLQRLELDVHELADHARRAPVVAAAIAKGERSLNVLRGLAGGEAFGRMADAFLATHGEVGQEGFELGQAAFADDPALLLSCVEQRLRAPGEDPRARHARVRTQADALAERIRARLADRTTDLERFEEVLAAATSAGPLSEEHNYWIDRVAQAHVNRVALAFGARLVRDRVLRSADEIHLLYTAEVARALREPRDLTALVTKRAAQVRHWNTLRAPRTLGAPETAPPPVTPGVSLARIDLDHIVAQDDPHVLKGVAASPGIARGPARLLGEGDFSKMHPGDILICRSSNASWVPVFTIAAAVVTEVGGSLSHAAVVAREFGVPCVVATGVALSTLTDGEMIEVDGDAGVVRRLFPVTWADSDDAKLVWRRDDAHHTGVMTPLAIEYTRMGPGYGVRKRDETLGPPVLMRFQAFNGRMYSSTKPLRPPDEMERYQREALARRRRLARHIRKDWDERYLAELDELYERMRAVVPKRMSRDDAARAWEDLWRAHRRAWTIHMLVTAGSYTVMDELRQTYEELVGGPASDAYALTQGLAHTLQRMDRDLAGLADSARREPRVAEAIARGAGVEELRTIDGAFGRAIDAFLAAHGDAGQSAEGLGAPSWSDDPSLLVGAIGQRLAQSGEHPDERLARLHASADKSARAARERLAGRPDDLARFEEVLAAARSAGPLTEEHNYWLDRRNQAHMSRAVRRFAARLVAEGALADREEIFLLYVPEIREALREPRDLTSLVTSRREEQRRWKSMVSPDSIGAPAPAMTIAAGTSMAAMSHLMFKQEQEDPARTLRGVGASAGVVRGPARLIRDLGDSAKLRHGDVLVCQSSNVSWIPLFVNAIAVVTEVGGALSHAAVVAREFGIPCVVGTGIALSTLTDGELVEVDGSAGVVRRLSA